MLDMGSVRTEGIPGSLGEISFRDGRTWAIAVRRVSYKSLIFLNSGLASLEKKEIQF